MEINQNETNVIEDAIKNGLTEESDAVNMDLIDDLGGMDLFGDDFGGEKSGIDEHFLEKFKAGINEDVLLRSIEFNREEKWSGVTFTFKTHEGLEQDFRMFAPSTSTQKDPVTGAEFQSWNPLIMKDAQGRPLTNDKAKARAKGGIMATDTNGRKLRTPQNKLIFRNETESEAKVRQITKFKNVLNSVIATYCKEQMSTAWKAFISKGSPRNWGEYLTRVLEVVTEYAPICDANDRDWMDIPLRVKLYRKYDSTTSNKRSEKFLELPKSVQKGLFMERMRVDASKYVVSIDNYEQANYIDAPKAQAPSAGLNNPLTATPAGNGMPQLGVMTGLPNLPTVPGLS